MAEGRVNTSNYKSIIFMNSSVRGPFMPPYFPVRCPSLPKPHFATEPGALFGLADIVMPLTGGIALEQDSDAAPDRDSQAGGQYHQLRASVEGRQHCK